MSGTGFKVSEVTFRSQRRVSNMLKVLKRGDRTDC